MNVTRRSQKQLKIQMETGLEAARDSRESRMGSQRLVELRLPWGRKLLGLEQEVVVLNATRPSLSGG